MIGSRARWMRGQHYLKCIQKWEAHSSTESGNCYNEYAYDDDDCDVCIVNCFFLPLELLAFGWHEYKEKANPSTASLCDCMHARRGRCIATERSLLEKKISDATRCCILMQLRTRHTNRTIHFILYSMTEWFFLISTYNESYILSDFIYTNRCDSSWFVFMSLFLPKQSN